MIRHDRYYDYWLVSHKHFSAFQCIWLTQPSSFAPVKKGCFVFSIHLQLYIQNAVLQQTQDTQQWFNSENTEANKE